MSGNQANRVDKSPSSLGTEKVSTALPAWCSAVGTGPPDRASVGDTDIQKLGCSPALTHSGYSSPITINMRYLVRARLKPGKGRALFRAIENGTLGAGSVAGGEYIRVMKDARLLANGDVKWVEVCYCEEPLKEESPYWEEYFEILSVSDAHGRANCRDVSGEEPWACGECDCTVGLEVRFARQGKGFLQNLESG